MQKFWILFVFCCVTAGNAIPTQSSSSKCAEVTSLSCSFHSTCVEATFQCGAQGVALGYAQPRCEQLGALQHSDSDCSTCLQDQGVLDWILSSEECFQSQLFDLLQAHPSGIPDPPVCLEFESFLLNVLDKCYSEGDLFCPLMDSVSLDVLESDLKLVLNTVTVNSYYKNVVTKQFRDLINSCNHLQASTLATKVAPETESIVLCALLLVQGEPSTEGLAEALAGKLNQSSSGFKVASYDENFSGECERKSKPDWKVSSADFYLVHWTLEEGANKTALTSCQEAGSCTVNHSQLVYFPYSSFTTSFCGNGLREAGELCDLFVYTGQKQYGCDEECQPISGYECTTQQLQQSFCAPTVCGDGHRTSNEDCDGGAAHVIGCNPELCFIVEGYSCDTPYNATSQCTGSLFVPQFPTSSTQESSPPPGDGIHD